MAYHLKKTKLKGRTYLECLHRHGPFHTGTDNRETALIHTGTDNRKTVLIHTGTDNRKTVLIHTGSDNGKTAYMK